jgi:hypothetical protein
MIWSSLVQPRCRSEKYVEGRKVLRGERCRGEKGVEEKGGLQ